MIWLALVAVGLGGFLLWWLIYETEGVYLGRRVVIWLYDRFAPRYDTVKEFSPEYDHVLLAKPLMGLLAPHQSPMVLDVATGTGRLPEALLNHVLFQGRIIGLDLSRRMMDHAQAKFAADGDRVTWVYGPAEGLPFHDDSFDAVTCLEALEFFSDPDSALDEMARVLRPGSVLLTTNRIGTPWMPGRTHDEASLVARLEHRGFFDVVIEPWQVDYQRVWARLHGHAEPVGARPAVEVLIEPAVKIGPDGRIEVLTHNGEFVTILNYQGL